MLLALKIIYLDAEICKSKQSEIVCTVNYVLTAIKYCPTTQMFIDQVTITFIMKTFY